MPPLPPPRTHSSHIFLILDTSLETVSKQVRNESASSSVSPHLFRSLQKYDLMEDTHVMRGEFVFPPPLDSKQEIFNPHPLGLPVILGEERGGATNTRFVWKARSTQQKTAHTCTAARNLFFAILPSEIRHCHSRIYSRLISILTRKGQDYSRRTSHITVAPSLPPQR